MVIRAKYHWLMLFLFVLYSALALAIVKFKTDRFMAPWYAALAALCLLFWLTTYTELDGGILTKRILFLKFRSFPVGEIDSIQPHRKNGKWSYGTVIEVWSKGGSKLTLQPNKPKPFLTSLKEQAPQARFLL